jgi:hypothetical protein
MKTFLALYCGQPGAQMPDQETIGRGMAAWTKWMEDHAEAVVEGGGPLGKTKRVDKAGVSDVRNEVGGYVVVRAEDQDAAARMFLNHPHFSVFPGDRVEVMEVMPIPTM